MSIFFGPKPPQRVRNLHAKLRKGGTMTTATLNWTTPVARTDGTPLTAAEIDHSTIFDGGVQIGIVPGATNTFTTGNLTTGIHNFTLTVTDTTGHTSAVSNTATVTVPVILAAPEAVTDLMATLNTTP